MKRITTISLAILATLTTAHAVCPASYTLESKWQANDKTSYQICHKLGSIFYTLQKNEKPYSVGVPETDASESGWSMQARTVQNEVALLTISANAVMGQLQTYMGERPSVYRELVINNCPKNYTLESSWATDDQSDLYQVCHQMGTIRYVLQKNGKAFSVRNPESDADESSWTMQGKSVQNEDFIFSIMNGYRAAELKTYMNGQASLHVQLKPK